MPKNIKYKAATYSESSVESDYSPEKFGNGGGSPNYHSSANNAYRFQPAQYRDLWAAVLFLINLGGLVICGILYIPPIFKSFRTVSASSVSSTQTYESSTGLSLSGQDQKDLIYVFYTTLCTSALGFLLSVGYLFLLRTSALFLVQFTYIFFVIFSLGMGLYFLLALKSIILGIIMIVLACISAVMFFLLRRRMKLTAALLKVVAKILAKYPGITGAGIVTLVVQFIYLCIWTAVSSACTHFYVNFTGTPDQSYSQKFPVVYNVLMVYLMFSLYWSSQVIKNVYHVTVCGVTAAYMFLSKSPAQMPKSPTSEAAKRALTTSFGSVCFGSLLVAIVQTMRYIVQTLARNRSENNILLTLLASCCDCLLGLLQSIFEYINHYAFTQVAIYGKNFVTAAKDTMELFKDRGLDVYLNDSLVGNVVGFGVAAGGVIVAVAGGLLKHFVFVIRDSTYTHGILYLVLTIIISFLVGLAMMSVMTEAISSSVSCLFVCLAEDAPLVALTEPELYSEFQANCPQVLYEPRVVTGAPVVYV